MWQLDEQERVNRKYVDETDAEITILPESWLKEFVPLWKPIYTTRLLPIAFNNVASKAAEIHVLPAVLAPSCPWN